MAVITENQAHGNDESKNTNQPTNPDNKDLAHSEIFAGMFHKQQSSSKTKRSLNLTTVP